MQNDYCINKIRIDNCVVILLLDCFLKNVIEIQFLKSGHMFTGLSTCLQVYTLRFLTSLCKHLQMSGHSLCIFISMYIFTNPSTHYQYQAKHLPDQKPNFITGYEKTVYS